MRIYCVIIAVLLSKTLVGQSIQEADKFYHENQFDKANSLYQEALKKSPSDPIILYNLGNSKFKGGHINDAIIFFQKSIETSEDKALTAKANNNLGLALIKAGNLREAIKAFKAALRIKPNDDECRQNLQMALNQSEKQDDGQKNNKEHEQDQLDNRNNKKEGKSKMAVLKSYEILDLVQKKEAEFRASLKKQFKDAKPKSKKDW